MGETDKPFACTNEGCQMTFTNEDHLNVHRKKHDMVLNLGLTYKNNVTADQTPTPTRFIRNCEEVGLFQDLQNVNPFEETFRKAIEHPRTGILHMPDTPNEDSLHTPQIFHHISENNIKSETSIKHFNDSTEINNPLLQIDSKDSLSKDDCLSPVENSINENGFSYSTEVSTSNEREYELSSSTSNDTIVEDFSIVKKNLNNYLLKPNKHGTKSNVKEKIKEVLHNKRKDVKPLDLKIKDNDLSTTIAKKNRPRINLKSKLRGAIHPETDSNKGQTQHSLYLYDKNLNEVEKRRAMNRMAQMRSRKRKKMWLDQMEQEIEKLKADNKIVVLENQKLKEENVLLKSMLLKHNNCQLSDFKIQNGNGSTEILHDNKLTAVQAKPILFNTFTIQPLQNINHFKINQSAPSSKLASAVQLVQKSLPTLFPKTNVSSNQSNNKTNQSDTISHSDERVLNLTNVKTPRPTLQIKGRKNK